MKRRASHGSSDVESPLSDALERNELATPVLENSRNDASFEQNYNHRDEVDDESAADTELLSEDSMTEFKHPSCAGERLKWWKLYTLHFMFMWSTRTYEYASVSLLSLPLLVKVWLKFLDCLSVFGLSQNSLRDFDQGHHLNRLSVGVCLRCRELDRPRTDSSVASSHHHLI